MQVTTALLIARQYHRYNVDFIALEDGNSRTSQTAAKGKHIEAQEPS